MLLRLVSSVSELILPETQCGFRRDRSTVDMVFVLRQLQEKCIEQHQELYMVFVDLTKAFDAVNRPLLWEVLRKFGYPPKFLSILGALHDGAMVRVVGEGGKSEPFLVTSGVRQGCVIAPVIFNLFVAAVMISAKQRLDPTDGVKLIHRMDGNLFNLRRLQARTLVTHESVLELQYADDAAFVECSAEGLQANLDVVVECYQGAGLVINTGKTEAMAMEAQDLDPLNFKISDAQLNNVDRFCYLGFLLSSSGNIDEEVQRRIGMAPPLLPG